VEYNQLVTCLKTFKLDFARGVSETGTDSSSTSSASQSQSNNDDSRSQGRAVTGIGLPSFDYSGLARHGCSQGCGLLKS
jgi:hypothetical protein